MTPKHVLAVTDFSEGADEALRQAHGYARLSDAQLTALHVVPDFMRANPLFPDGSVGDIDQEVELEKRALDDLQERLRELTGRRPGDFVAAVRIGAIDVSVVRYAEEHGVDLIVLGATGRTGLARLLLGTTAERVTRYAHCSVLVARAASVPGNVLVATDLSDEALPAVHAGRDEAKRRGAKLHLAHALDFSALGWAAAAAPLGGFAVPVPPNALGEMRRLAEESLKGIGGADAVPHVVEGSAKRVLASLAESIPAELLVVATRGRTGLKRMALGSVAETMVRDAPCSVLVVRR